MAHAQALRHEGEAPDGGGRHQQEVGGWVNADGDFGSPQFINWNWPPVNATTMPRVV